MDPTRSAASGDDPTARPALSRKSSTKVTYADDIPQWTPELEAELANAKAALHAANKKWSPDQEEWIPEVRNYICFWSKACYPE